jgi:hypothetical protein
MANLSVQMVNSIEGYRAWVSDKTLIALSQALGIEVFQLFTPGIEIRKQDHSQLSMEAERRADNAKKAKAAADNLFPGEKWKTVEEGIYLSPRRAIGKKSNYKDELRDAQILRNFGSTVFLTPEQRNDRAKKYDAIVDGLKMEFKNQSGSSVRTLKDHFIDSREQAPNVFINLEDSPLTKQQITHTLNAARNSGDYGRKNRFKGGRIILKIRGRENLLYLDVDRLKI